MQVVDASLAGFYAFFVHGNVSSDKVIHEAFFCSLQCFVVGFSFLVFYYEHRVAVLPQDMV